jgi:hypothetical protein
LRSGFWENEDEILKTERFFVHHGLKNKNLSHFFKGATSWENQSCLSASFFGFLVFPVTVPILWELFRRGGDEI